MREIRTQHYAVGLSRLAELARQRRYDQVLEEARVLMAEGSRSAALTVYLADALARGGRPAEALEALEPWETELSPYGQTLLAGLLEKAGRAEESARQFEAVLLSEPSQTSVRKRALQYLRHTHQHERALAHAQSWGLGVGAIADLLVEMGRKDEAIKRLSECPELETNPSLGLKLTLLGISDLPPDERKAELELLAGLPEYRDDPMLVVQLSKVRRELGETDENVESLRRSLAAQPENRYLLLQLALALRARSDFEESLTILESLLRRFPRDDIIRSSYFATCRKAGQRERARRQVEELSRQDPRHTSLWGAYHRAFSARMLAETHNAEETSPAADPARP